MSRFWTGITADLARSHGTYLFDVVRDGEVLDLFGLFASLPLGYDHPALRSTAFLADVVAHAGVKLPTTAVDCRAAQQFWDAFVSCPAMAPFGHFDFYNTGALAVEAAVKIAAAALEYPKPLTVLTFRGSFHGITGYGGLLAHDEGPASMRMAGWPSGFFGPALEMPTERTAGAVIEAAARQLAVRPCAVLVEPLLCTAGDIAFPSGFLLELRDLCVRYGRPLIVDEIQTGFGGTGSMWYFQQLGFIPDIVVFGKKAQVSGVMARPAFDASAARPDSFATTWNADVVDMIRCRAILGAFTACRILENVRTRGAALRAGLMRLPIRDLVAVRQIGLLLALEFSHDAARDRFYAGLLRENVIASRTGEYTIRLRPHLALSSVEAEDVLARFERAA